MQYCMFTCRFVIALKKAPTGSDEEQGKFLQNFVFDCTMSSYWMLYFWTTVFFSDSEIFNKQISPLFS